MFEQRLKKARERARSSQRSVHARGLRCCARGRGEARLLEWAGVGEQLERRSETKQKRQGCGTEVVDGGPRFL